MIIVIASFLFLEQLIYAFYINEPASLIGRVHVFTAILSLILALSAFCIFKYLMPLNTKILNMHVFISIFSYFTISIYRTIYIQTDSLSFLPIIYIAVIYGFSFITYLESKIDFTLYTLAFSASVISYNRFEKDYQYKKKLLKKNKNLMKISSTDM